MIEALDSLLCMLPKAEKGSMYADELDCIQDGDLQPLPLIARRLEFGIGLEKQPKLAERLFDWCVATHNCREWQLREWHRADNRPWSASEVKELLFLCSNTNVFAFSVVVEAIVSDTELLHRFKKQALQAHQRLAKHLSALNEELTVWHARLMLDPRMKLAERDQEHLMDALEADIHEYSDPSLARFYIEKAVRMIHAGLGKFDLEEALASLKYSHDPVAYAFYQGLSALCDGRYEAAYPAFAATEDTRCRLAQAYCLIHGLGVPADQDAGRAILKAYPNDGFALYLLAVSLYRTRGGDSIPDEVIELLDESDRLGYRPAKVTKLSMVLKYAITRRDEADKRVSAWDQLSDIADRDRDSTAYGMYQYGLLQKALNRLRTSMAVSGDCLEAQSALSEDEEVKLWGDDVLDVDGINCSALGCYSRALYHMHVLGYQESHYWEEGLKRFDQSAEARRWALHIAMVDSVFGNLSNDMDFLLSLYRFDGASEEDLLAWYMVLSLHHSILSAELHDLLAHAVVEKFKSKDASLLEKALLACMCCNHMYGSKDVELAKQALAETAESADPLIQELRHKAMLCADLLDGVVGSDLLESRLVGQADWLDQFIGYSFFDYNV